MLKNLLIVVQLTADELQIYKNHSELRSELETNAAQARNKNMRNGEQDDFLNFQAATAPALRPGLRLDMLFNYEECNAEDEMLMWSQDVIQIVSDRTNIAKESGGFHTRGDCQVL